MVSYETSVLRKLVELNEMMTNRATCRSVCCNGIVCEECPFRLGDSMNLGDIRKEYRSRKLIDIEVDYTDNSGTVGINIEGASSEHKADPVKTPSHYMLFDGTESIEVIARSMTVSEFRGFCFGNVLKYRLRAGKKSELATMEQDLNKAEFYKELFNKHKELCHA
jgi:hypothetical protein